MLNSTIETKIPDPEITEMFCPADSQIGNTSSEDVNAVEFPDTELVDGHGVAHEVLPVVVVCTVGETKLTPLILK